MAKSAEVTKSLEKKANPSKSSVSLSDEEELDLRLAVAMMQRLLDEKGLDLIKQALNTSKDPAQVVGNLLSQMIVQMQENFPPELNVSPRIYLAKNGALEQILDFIEKRLGLPSRFSDDVYGTVVEIIKAGAMSPEQAQGGAAQPQQSPQPAPPAPQARLPAGPQV